MKNKIIITFLIGVLSFSSIAQEISTVLPVLSPQTPTTSDLGKYGDVQVNESSGKISPSIPLFTYKVGDFELPLTLNYSGNGVKVNQDPTWAGVNWNINPSGLITREVNDLPDELTPLEKRLYINEFDIQNILTSQGYDEWENKLFSLSEDNSIDTEVDIFHFNFLDFSGSFYIDKNDIVHIIKKNKELKILFQKDLNSNNKSEFIIVTPDGNQYFFGGVSASESSRVFVNNGAGSLVNVPYIQNAFYLHSIHLYSGIQIFFDYDDYDTNCDYVKIGITESASMTYPLNLIPCNKFTKTLYSDIQNAVVLKNITNNINDEKVEFITSKTGKCNRFIKLNEIILTNNNLALKKVKLLFNTIENEAEIAENKFFLKDVEFYGRSSQYLNKYELFYHTPELFPSKSSFAQDHLGYFNGKTTNNSLLTVTSDLLIGQNTYYNTNSTSGLNNYSPFELLSMNCNFLGDREPDFESSKIGVLTKIIYPTKGFSEFEYELPYKGEEDVITNHYLNVYYRDENRNNTTLLLASYNPIDNPLVLSNEKKVKVDLNIMANGSFSHQNRVKLEVYKKVNTSWVLHESTYKALTNSENTIINYNENYSFNLPAGIYSFKLILIPTALGTNNSVIATATLKLPLSTRPTYYPGLRIKRTKSYDNLGNEEIKRYYYKSLENLSVIEEDLEFKPNYIIKTILRNFEYIPWGISIIVTEDRILDHYTISTSSVKSPFNEADSHNFIYKYVTTSYGGDNFENGGKESEYIRNRERSIDLYIPDSWISNLYGETSYSINFTKANPNDYSFSNATLINERYFKSNLKSIKEVSYNYVESIKNYSSNINSLKVYTVTPASSIWLESTTIPYFYFMFRKNSFEYRLTSTTTKEYFGPNFTDEVVTTTNYTYKPDKVSLPSVIETTNSALETTTTKLFYPSDVSELSNLSPTEIASLNTLQQQHNIGALVRTENYLNNTMLGAKQVSFASFGSKIYPRKISTFKGSGENSLEDRIDFYSYFFGKPSLLSQTDGTKVKYEYNSNHQVVLKIENYAGASISVDPDNPPVANNPSGTASTAPCYYQNLYPDSMVTSYEYDPVTNNLIKITDPKCDVYTYRYDKFNRLESVIDAHGKVISENEYHYKQ